MWVGGGEANFTAIILRWRHASSNTCSTIITFQRFPVPTPTVYLGLHKIIDEFYNAVLYDVVTWSQPTVATVPRHWHIEACWRNSYNDLLIYYSSVRATSQSYYRFYRYKKSEWWIIYQNNLINSYSWYKIFARNNYVPRIFRIFDVTREIENSTKVSRQVYTYMYVYMVYAVVGSNIKFQKFNS